MKFIVASIVFILFMWFVNTAVDKIYIDHRDYLNKNWTALKRLNTFSRFVGFFIIMSFVCFFASIIYVILK